MMIHFLSMSAGVAENVFIEDDPKVKTRGQPPRNSWGRYIGLKYTVKRMK
jgi:hypothetical protein